MANLAIIPARGGSKRLPRKNIIRLAGKPLIHYTLEAVVGSQLFEHIILSSDDKEILDIGSEVKGVTPELRDKNLAGDHVKVIDLVKSIACRKGVSERYEKIGLFLPTCPFRNAADIVKGSKLLSEDAYSVISVCKMQEPVQLSLSIDENNNANLESLIKPSPLITGETRSQDFNQYYRVNGGFYLSWMEKFVQKDNFFSGKSKSFYYGLFALSRY